GLDPRDVRGARTLRAVDHLETDAVALGQALETLTEDRGVVDEHVRPALAREESETLGVVEPLDGTFDHLDAGLLGPSLVCDVLVRPAMRRRSEVTGRVEKRRSDGNETGSEDITSAGRLQPKSG